MKFDFVFDVQSAFREIVYAFSYPGEIVQLSKEACTMPTSMECFPATQVLMYMLLDAETDAHILAKDPTTQQLCTQVTYCTIQEVTDAQFIFVLKARNQSLGDILQHANRGTLLDPQEGATVIVECEEINDCAGYNLKGPGIKEKNTISLMGLPEDWFTIRNLCCEEYPLGTDMIFVDRTGHCAVIPRTTRITR